MTFEKTPETRVDQTQKAAAEAWATEILRAWSQDQYPLPDSSLSDEMKPGQSKTYQQESDKEIEAVFGDFKSMSYVESRTSDPARFVIYRFRGSFTKSDQTEVRMVYNLNGKIDGFWVKVWHDAM
jgi:hypothetical protein